MSKLNVLLCGLISAVIVQANDEQAIAKCTPLFALKYMEKPCCESFERMMKKDLLEECKEKTSKDDECGFPKCMAEKEGLLDSDGTINEEAMRDLLNQYESDYPDSREMFVRAQEKCLDGKFKHYAPSEDTCEPLALHLCLYMNTVVMCDSWRDSDDCKVFAEKSKECKEAMDA